MQKFCETYKQLNRSMTSKSYQFGNLIPKQTGFKEIFNYKYAIAFIHLIKKLT